MIIVGGIFPPALKLFAMKNVIFIFLGLFWLCACTKSEPVINNEEELPSPENESKVIKTEVKRSNGKWALYRDGKPYFIKGAGGGGEYVMWDNLKKYGGNSMRIYGINDNTSAALNMAEANELSVMIGISLPGENGFDYKDPVKCKTQLENIRRNILKYKDHPAVLAWAIGNEIIGVNSSPEIFGFMNDVSEMIHQVDTNHPTLIVTAGITTDLANKIADYIPDLDFVGVNWYAAIHLIYPNISQSRLNKPYVITEWGINGPWEVGKTPWGTSVEPSSRVKAEQFRNRYANHIVSHDDLCLGSYGFLWGQKPEGSPTWFGLFFNGEALEMVDELTKAWTGEYPDNRAPSILNSTLNGFAAKGNVIIKNKETNKYTHEIYDFENDELTVEYLIRPDNTTEGLIDDGKHSLPYLPNIISDETLTSCKLSFNENHNGKSFRLFVFLRDSKNRIATENRPFKVELENINVKK